MLQTLAVANYRSLRELILPLGRLNLVVGPNGSGKSSVYRALRLLAETAQGRLIATLAREGGFDSTLWAGPESISRAMRRGEHKVQGAVRQGPISLKLGFAGESFGYAIDLGLPAGRGGAFSGDPEIKREAIWTGPMVRPSALLIDRRYGLVRARGDEDDWDVVTADLAPFETLMTRCTDPRHTPEALRLREEIRGWRFYDQFRSDAASPARQPQVGTHTPVLDHDGHDLAAAWQTIVEIGDAEALHAAIDDAFRGSRVDVSFASRWFEIEMQQHGLLRSLRAAELSDGTLRYILWVAALLTPRPPELLVLNEPETSLHPDLLPPLGRLIVDAARRSQVIVVSHAAALIDVLQSDPSCDTITLSKSFGETQADCGGRDRPAWRWLER